MIPSDYRLENICARLVERLDGTRRSYAGRWNDAAAVFEMIAVEQVQAAVDEMEALDLGLNSTEHALFLKNEVLQTFLPRYLRLAGRITQKEEWGYGFGPLEPITGRFVLLCLGVLGFILLEPLAFRLPVVWGLAILSLLLPVFPDVTRWSVRRRYRQELGSLLSDLRRVQDQSQRYSPSLDRDLNLEDELAEARRRQQRSSNGRQNHSI